MNLLRATCSLLLLVGCGPERRGGGAGAPAGGPGSQAGESDGGEIGPPSGEGEVPSGAGAEDDPGSADGEAEGAGDTDAEGGDEADGVSHPSQGEGEGEGEGQPPGPIRGSIGCGQPASHPLGGTQVAFDAGVDGDGERGFFLTIPDDYDPATPHRLMVGYAGTDWVGQQIRPYLDLERLSDLGGPWIFVYPDLLWRDFEGWGNLGGWVLGPHAQPAHGMGDLNFTEQLLDELAGRYCIDLDRVFTTGHSWGGDMAMVAACFLGERFAASVPVAANRPYWFEVPSGGWAECVGDTAVWTLFGQGDDHFSEQGFPGQFGQECRDFWLSERGCPGALESRDLRIGDVDECVVYDGCSSEVRYCQYDARFGHQRPDYLPEVTMEWLAGF